MEIFVVMDDQNVQMEGMNVIVIVCISWRILNEKIDTGEDF